MTASACARSPADSAGARSWRITVLIATGIPLASDLHQWGSDTLHVKLALVAVVAGLVVLHMRRPQINALEGGIFVGSLAIAWLGVSLAH